MTMAACVVKASCSECGREFDTLGEVPYVCVVCEKPMCVECETGSLGGLAGYAHKACAAKKEKSKS